MMGFKKILKDLRTRYQQRILEHDSFLIKIKNKHLQEREHDHIRCGEILLDWLIQEYVLLRRKGTREIMQKVYVEFFPQLKNTYRMSRMLFLKLLASLSLQRGRQDQNNKPVMLLFLDFCRQLQSEVIATLFDRVVKPSFSNLMKQRYQEKPLIVEQKREQVRKVNLIPSMKMTREESQKFQEPTISAENRFTKNNNASKVFTASYQQESMGVGKGRQKQISSGQKEAIKIPKKDVKSKIEDSQKLTFNDFKQSRLNSSTILETSFTTAISQIDAPQRGEYSDYERQPSQTSSVLNTSTETPLLNEIDPSTIISLIDRLKTSQYQVTRDDFDHISKIAAKLKSKFPKTSSSSSANLQDSSEFQSTKANPSGLSRLELEAEDLVGKVKYCKTEITSFCHKVGFPEPRVSSQQDKSRGIYLARARLDVTGEHSDYKFQVIEGKAEAKYPKKAEELAVGDLIKKVYVTRHDLWKIYLQRKSQRASR